MKSSYILVAILILVLIAILFISFHSNSSNSSAPQVVNASVVSSALGTNYLVLSQNITSNSSQGLLGARSVKFTSANAFTPYPGSNPLSIGVAKYNSTMQANVTYNSYYSNAYFYAVNVLLVSPQNIANISYDGARYTIFNETLFEYGNNSTILAARYHYYVVGTYKNYLFSIYILTAGGLTSQFYSNYNITTENLSQTVTEPEIVNLTSSQIKLIAK